MPSCQERTVGAILGLATGNALGVPTDYCSRQALRSRPVSGMTGGGLHGQLPGTWSGETSLTLCTAESLVGGLNLDDMRNRFVRWMEQGYWTARGVVFDLDSAARSAVSRLRNSTLPASPSDSIGQSNGSLVRSLPVALYVFDGAGAERQELVSRVSAMTHPDSTAIMACQMYSMIVAGLMKGLDPQAAYAQVCEAPASSLLGRQETETDRSHYARFLAGKMGLLRDKNIRSGTYAVSTLEASVWCLLTTSDFRSAVLRAVNLGENTSAVGAVTGGLAGATYGVTSIPSDWVDTLARREDVTNLARGFSDTVLARQHLG